MERPKGNFEIKEIEGDKEVIVVIPTIDINSNFAQNCKNKIFKGLHIIFIESGYHNFYFNYAHNCNAGIKKAMTYNPKWVVLSNDDIDTQEDIKVLIAELRRIKELNTDFVYCQNRKDISNTANFSETTFQRNLLFRVTTNYTRNLIKLEKKFGVKYLLAAVTFPNKKLFKVKFSMPATSDFVILNSDLLRNIKDLFDETFINGGEDIEFSLRIFLRKSSYISIQYSIESRGGGSLGKKGRMLKDIANLAYLNYKMEKMKFIL